MEPVGTKRITILKCVHFYDTYNKYETVNNKYIQNITDTQTNFS